MAAATDELDPLKNSTVRIKKLIAISALAVAGYMAKRKEAVRPDTDQFVRA